MLLLLLDSGVEGRVQEEVELLEQEHTLDF